MSNKVKKVEEKTKEDSSEVRVPKGNYLLRENDNSFEMYYLKKGKMAVYKQRGNTEIQIGTIEEGELVGELSFLDRELRSASVKAIGECILKEIPEKKFNVMYRKLPVWYQALIRTLLHRLRRANKRIRI